MLGRCIHVMHTCNLAVNGEPRNASVNKGEVGLAVAPAGAAGRDPAHGYELKQALEQTFGSAYPSPNIGQIYVTLGRLEKDGLIRAVDVEQSNRPNKKVYYLTAKGRDVLTAWVESRPRARGSATSSS